MGTAPCIDAERRLIVTAAHVWNNIPCVTTGLDPRGHGVAIGFRPLEKERAARGDIDWVGRAFLCEAPGVLAPPYAASPRGLDLVVLQITQQLDGSPLPPGRRVGGKRRPEPRPVRRHRSPLAATGHPATGDRSPGDRRPVSP